MSVLVMGGDVRGPRHGGRRVSGGGLWKGKQSRRDGGGGIGVGVVRREGAGRGRLRDGGEVVGGDGAQLGPRREEEWCCEIRFSRPGIGADLLTHSSHGFIPPREIRAAEA